MLPLLKLVHTKKPSPGVGRVLGITVLFLSTSTFAFAKQQPPGGGPPPEAFTACEKSAQDEVCSVETSKGELTGICRKDRRSEALLCVPEKKNKDKKPREDKTAKDTNSN